MRKLICLLLVLCCAGLNTGCWDADEITSLAVITGIGIDAATQPHRINLSIQVSPPGASGPGGSARGGSYLRVLSIETESILEGIINLHGELRRRYFLSQLRFVVIGENLARSGISSVISGLLEATEIRGSVPLFVTYGSAEAVLRAHSGIGRTPSEDIANLLENVMHSPTARKMTINQAINILQGRGSELTMPILDLAPEALEAGDNQPADGVGQGGERYSEVAMARTAIFSRDRWIDTLDRFETNLLVLLLGEGTQAAISLPNPADPTEPLAIQIEHFSSKITIIPRDDQPPQVVVRPEMVTGLLDMQGGSYSMADRGLKPIEMACEFDIGQLASQLIAKLQQLQVDTLGIGQKIAQRYPKAWSKLEPIWSEVYPEVQFDVQPHAIIRSTGLIKRFFQVKPNK